MRGVEQEVLFEAARAQGQTEALPSWNDGPTKKAITDSCPGSLSRVDLILCALPNVLRCSIMTAVAGATNVCPACICARSREGAGIPTSGMEGQAAVQGSSRRRHEGSCRSR